LYAKNCLHLQNYYSNNAGKIKNIEMDYDDHLRKTKHTHNPVDDAKGNAEALLALKNEMGLKIKL